MAARWLLWLVVPLGAVQVAVLSFHPLGYALAALFFSAVLASGSIAVEEYQGTELTWNSLPVSRGQVVAARYLTTLVGMLGGLAVSWAAALPVALVESRPDAGAGAMLSFDAHAVLFGLLALAAAVYLPLYFRFGAGRSVIYFMAIAVATLIVVSLVARLIMTASGYSIPTDPDGQRALIMRMIDWVAPRFAWLLSLFVGGAALAMGVSLAVSRRIYATRDL
jgi:ABC-type transport system involved in multi-copper enzyme maturation permease subunit